MGRYLKIKLKTVGLITRDQEARLKKAIKLIEIILNTNMFMVELLKIDLSCIDGETPSDIYLNILEGAELNKDSKIQEVEMNVSFFYKDNPVLGTANVRDGLVRLNTKYFENSPLNHVCSTIVREWLQCLGYSKIAALDLASVPASVGYLVRNLIIRYDKQISKIGELDGKKKLKCRKFLFAMFKCCKFK